MIALSFPTAGPPPPVLEIIWITLPLYLLILSGYAAFRWRYLVTDGLGALGAFVVRVSLPALIFQAIATPREGVGFEWSFLLGYLGASFAGMLIGRAIMRRAFDQPPAISWVFGLGMSSSNTGFMGFAITSLVFGPEAAAAFAMIIIVESAIMVPFAMVAANVAASPQADWKALAVRSLSNAARNPLLLAVALAVAARLVEFTPPEPLERAISMMAAVAAPVALFAVGGTVARFPISGAWRRSIAISAFKLLAHPALTALAFWALPGVSPGLAAIGIANAAMPMLSLFPLLGQPHGGEQVCATSLILSTAASFLTISLLVGYLA
ncbi:AEC family transporter [Albimonas sp. CAU 1670]|uniref:AEC family transporter n=1 Tax=Albimonas sp. CAU 1670 TaxID=3032599 RepID=UPI0023DA690C|nr:AEC family transporter [Albimonas sp. CAU 1670]MDF2234733.1 AEC family transporter [Albimonas sp. CAU 1670]